MSPHFDPREVADDEQCGQREQSRCHDPTAKSLRHQPANGAEHGDRRERADARHRRFGTFALQSDEQAEQQRDAQLDEDVAAHAVTAVFALGVSFSSSSSKSKASEEEDSQLTWKLSSPGEAQSFNTTFDGSKLALGNFMRRPSRVSAMIWETTTLRNHFRSAGTMNHGAHFALQRLGTAS